MKLHFISKHTKIKIIVSIITFTFAVLFPQSLLAEDFQLASGQTINVTLTSPSVTYTLTSTTGIDTLTVNGSTMTLTLSSGDTVTVTNANGYVMQNSLNQGTACGSSGSSITFTQTAILTSSTINYCGIGSGGSGSGAPSNTGITINSGNSETTSRSVVLALSANNATNMMLSHSIGFADASWETYAVSRSWTLTAGDGEKRVYVKYRSSTGQESSTISDIITLVGTSVSPVPTPAPVPTSGGGAMSPGAKNEEKPVSSLEGKLVKDPNKSAIYIVEKGKLRPYINAKIFFSHGKKFQDVVSTNIGSYSTGDAISIFPDVYNFTCGQLVKASNAKVYIVSKCDDGAKKEITWIETEGAFLAGGWSFKNVNYISDAKKAEFKEAETFKRTDAHPAGTLVKYNDSTRVYLLQNIDGVVKKSWIANEEEFNAKNFQTSDIVIITTREAYPDGPNIGGTVLGVSYDEITKDVERGSSGDNVMRLQKKLQALGYFPNNIKINGNFGPTTQSAVKDFQRANNISPTGKAGSQTRSVLNSL